MNGHYGFSDFMDEFEPSYQNRNRNQFDLDIMANQGFNNTRSHDAIYAEMERKNIETDGAYQAKITGDVGELKLSAILRSLPEYYHVIDNVLLLKKKGSTQIDHIIVCPFGIFVIETKNHKGMIFGDDAGAVWTQVLKNGGHFKMYNPVHQNIGHIAELSKQIRIPTNYMQGILVFTSDFANLDNVASSCCIVPDMLYDFITSYNRQLFNNKQVWKIIKRIDTVNKDGYINRQRHINYVKRIKDKRGW